MWNIKEINKSAYLDEEVCRTDTNFRNNIVIFSYEQSASKAPKILHLFGPSPMNFRSDKVASNSKEGSDSEWLNSLLDQSKKPREVETYVPQKPQQFCERGPYMATWIVAMPRRRAKREHCVNTAQTKPPSFGYEWRLWPRKRRSR